MAITSEINRKTHDGDGATLPFNFPYKFLNEAHLAVYLVDETTNVQALQTLTTHYTVAGAGDADGGTVTFLVAPTTNDQIVIINLPPLTQPQPYGIGAKLPAADIEASFDLATLQMQTFKEQLNRVFTLPIGSNASAQLPSYVAGQYIGWSATEQELANLAPPVVSEETLTFSDGLAKTASDVAVDLAASNPGLEFTAGTIRVKPDGLTIERASGGFRVRTGEQAVTISSGAITLSAQNLVVDTEGAASTDNLDTINAGSYPLGTIIVLRQTSAARDITLRNAVDNIFLRGGANATLDDGVKSITLQRRGSGFYEVARSFPETPVLTESYTSGETTLTINSTATLTHSLGAAPGVIFPYLICKTTEHGYSVGDLVPIDCNLANSATVNAGFTMRFDATNIWVRFGPSLAMTINHASSSSVVSITPANWKVIVRAFA